MYIQIKHRYTDAVLFEGEFASLREAALKAISDKADLSWANFSGANFSGADLSGANFSGADLSGADLSWANFSGADLSRADLSRADLSWANFSRADLSGADLSRAKNMPFVPIIKKLNTAILSAIEAGGTLNMSDWHTCETTHCRAGWAIHLAGDAGRVMESLLGPSTAGALLYHASTGRIPNFHATNADAMADLKACAALEAAPTKKTMDKKK